LVFILFDQLGFHPSLIFSLYTISAPFVQLFRYSTPPAYSMTVSTFPRARCGARSGVRASASRQCGCGRCRTRLYGQGMAWSTICLGAVSAGL